MASQPALTNRSRSSNMFITKNEISAVQLFAFAFGLIMAASSS